MKKLLLVVMMLCLAQSAFSVDWERAITAKKDDGTWKFTATQILDAAVEQEQGFDFAVWNYSAEKGRSDIVKVLLTEKPGYNKTYGELINDNTGGLE